MGQGWSSLYLKLISLLFFVRLFFVVFFGLQWDFGDVATDVFRTLQ
jgi:hypothetical protein